jgi:hypothetical protein
MWKGLLALLVGAWGCTIGDPSSTAPDTARGGRGTTAGRNAAGAGGGQSSGGDGGRAGEPTGTAGRSEGGAPDGAATGGTGGDGSGGNATNGGSGALAGRLGSGGSAGAPASEGGEAGTGDSGEGGVAGGVPQAGAGGTAPLPNYAGVWSGTTSQGGQIQFVYDGAGLVELSYDWVLPICGSTTIVTTPSRPAIVNGHLSYYAGGNPSTQFEIDFASATEAQGTFTFALTYTGPPVSVPVCRGNETVSFTASNAGPP